MATIAAAERERDAARANAERLTSEAKVAVDHLRAAEIRGHEAGERERKAAAACETRLQEQRAEQLRQKEIADGELRRLRQTLEEQQAAQLHQKEIADEELRRLRQSLDEQKAEGLRLAERERAFQATQAATAQELAQARDQRQRCETEVKALTRPPTC